MWLQLVTEQYWDITPTSSADPQVQVICWPMMPSILTGVQKAARGQHVDHEHATDTMLIPPKYGAKTADSSAGADASWHLAELALSFSIHCNCYFHPPQRYLLIAVVFVHTTLRLPFPVCAAAIGWCHC
jgi:hypothetical protein